MKTNYLKQFMFLVIGMLVLSSCEDSNEVVTEDVSKDFSKEEVLLVAEGDLAAEDVDVVVDDYFEFEEGFSSKSEESKNEGPNKGLDCVTKTVETTSTQKTVTLDFGDGCELPNGNVLSGKIILSFTKDSDVQSLTITKTYEDFYHNDIKVEGTSTIVKLRENDNGYPQSTKTFSKTLTWPEGEFYTREGTKTRVWVEGFDTRNWGDDFYETTGNWSIVKKDGTEISAEILEPLKTGFACKFIMSGIIELTKNGETGTLDFGDGQCDNKAVFTNSAGEEIEITLRNRNKKKN